MNLFERFGRVAKANLNQIISNLEDPEKVMTQAVEDLNKDLVTVRQSYAEVMATQKRMEKQKEAADKLTTEWLNRAQLAIQKGDEELAREALTRKQQNAEQAASLAVQLESQGGSLDALYSSMQQLESKIAEAKATKEQFIARARTAKTSTKVNDMLSGIGSSNMEAFDRMKEKVESLESQAEVSAQLTGSSADVSLESKFKALESGNDVDDELQMMKRQLTGKAEEPKQIESGSIDDELAKMKKSLE
eukprot:CAMPEP_0185767286 /NCGR_PEP_ID=MMETSP1174-20130828/41870_1 /TAXON_ID=35687 /ORGANISM="Dictyocha speculum, Strain CCMP1381" /LENGTH=247 /DNA_ID=CAMNT_0028451379 /DNA_START=173 /DNA_END=916 /DNA_ORIENTATION=+